MREQKCFPHFFVYKGVDLYMAFEITDIAKDLVKESIDLATESFVKRYRTFSRRS